MKKNPFYNDTYLQDLLQEGGGGGGFTPTEEQLTAMNSGITASDVEQIETNKTNITNLTNNTYTKQEIDNKVTAEENQRATADTNLQNQINTLNTNLETETTEREHDRQVLVGNITKNYEMIQTETTNRETADTNLQNQIDTLNTNLQTEVTNRTNADTNLQNQIDTANRHLEAEKQDRINSDTALHNQIETLNTNLQTEITNRTNADDTLTNSKQDKLVNQSNIKSINGQSVLGSGDLTVEAEYVETRTTLWTGDQYGAQDLTLSDNISNYNYFLLYCYDRTYSVNKYTLKISRNDLETVYQSNSNHRLFPLSWDNDSTSRWVQVYRKSDTTIRFDSSNTGLTKLVGVKATPVPALTLTSKLFLGVENLTQAQGSKTITITLDDGYVLTGASSSSEGNIFTNYISTITRDSSNPQKYNFLCWYSGANSGNQLRVIAYAIKIN